MASDFLRRYIDDAPINTDERPILEFSLPKHQYMDPLLGLDNIDALLKDAADFVPPVTVAPARREDFYLSLAKQYNKSNYRLAQAYSLFGKVLELNPSNKEAIYYLKDLKKELGIK